jgi:uncharacterized FlgJ-related protein
MALFKRRKREYLKNPIEKCVNCGVNTVYRFNDKIDTRTSYVEGCGQFCNSCYSNKDSLNYNTPYTKKTSFISYILNILKRHMKKMVIMLLLLLMVTGELKNGVVLNNHQFNLFSKENLARLIYTLKIAHPDIVMAQAIIESGNFKSKIFKENNNLFGMKMPEYRKTTAIGTNRGHAVYRNWRESVIDYALWQGKRARYTTTNQYLRRLRSYAADPNYITKIKKRI